MTMLPDVDETSWQDYATDQFSQDSERKIASLGAEQAMNARIADLSRIGVWAAQPEAAVPPPTPQPEPAPRQTAPPTVQAAPPAAAVQETSQAMDPWHDQIWRQAMRAAGGAGANLQQFSADLEQRLAGVSDTRAALGQALAAAGAAGADLQRFSDRFDVPERPAAQVAQAAPTGGGPLQDYARQAARKAGVDPDIFVRQIQQESGFNPAARSPAGAQGIAQIVPTYHPNVDPSDPYASLDYAANLMRSHLGRYGGDYSKALAAYNAGAGAVDRYGGVPPFEETTRYVNTIMSGAAPPRTPTPAEGITRAGAALGAANRDISQFGDPQLTNDEAYAACGPAAAVRFAQRFGRNPTLRESLDLAKTVGWTSAQGMAGLASEKALMDKLNVPTKLVQGPDWGTFAGEARTGNPVIISTRGHYFTADSWDPQSNRFHVGRSGLDLKGGSEWMTPQQMEAIMGPVQGGLLADNPQVASPSNADQDTSPGSWLGRTRKTLSDSFGGAQSILQQGIIEPLRGAFNLGAQELPPEAYNAARTPGFGYDPSSLRAVTEPPEPGIPLRRDVRDIAQPPQPSVAGTVGQVAEDLGRAAGRAAGGTGDVLRGIAGWADLKPPSETVQRQWRGEEDAQLGPIGIPGRIAAPFGVLGENQNIGPLHWATRRSAGLEQLQTADPEYGALADEMRLLLQRNTERALAGNPDTQPPEEAQRMAEIQQRMIDITNRVDLQELAKQNPKLEEYETQAALGQGVASTALLPGAIGRGPAAAARAVAANVIDPANLPFTALSEAPELIGRTIGRAAPRAGEALGLVSPAQLPPGRAATSSEISSVLNAPSAGGPNLINNLSGPVLRNVQDAVNVESTADELAAAQRTLDSVQGSSPLSPFPELQSAEGLAAARRQLRALADLGAEQRHWYEDSSREILKATQGNRQDAEKIAQLVAIYSNNTPVNENMNNAMTAWTQWKRGLPIDAPTLEGNNKRARELLEGGKDWEGAKTNNFYRNLMKEIDPAKHTEMGRQLGETGVTIDIWMMRALNSAVKSPSKGTGQYEFAAREVDQIAKERGWTPEQAQAAIWVATKSGWEHAANFRNPMSLRGEDIFHYGTAMERRMAQTPLAPIGGNEDALAAELGLLAPDGRISLPKARSTRAEQRLPGPAGEGAVDEASRRAMNAYVAGRGIQEQLPEVYWAREMGQARNLDVANGVAVNAGRRLDDAEVQALQARLDELTGPGTGRVVASDNGAWVLNQSADTPNKAFQTATGKALQGLQLPDLAEAQAVPRRFDSEFIANDWSAQPNGESYLDSVRLAGRGFDRRFQEISGRLGRPGGDAGPGAGPGRAASALTDFPVGAAQGGRYGELAAQAGGGAIAGGYQAAQQEGATPQDIALGAAGGAALGVARGQAARYAPGGAARLGGRVARIAEATGGEPPNVPELRKLSPEEVAGTEGLSLPANLRATFPAAGEEVQGVGQTVRQIPERPLPLGAEPISASRAAEVERLRLDVFPEDLRPDIEAAAERVDWARQQRRGVIPDAVAEEMATRYAGDTTLDQIIKQGSAGRTYSTEQIRALRNATAAQATKVYDLTTAINAGDDSSKALQQVWLETEKLERLVQIAEGGRAEAGRSLRAYQGAARLVDLAPNEALAHITKLIGGDRQKLVEMVREYSTLVDSGVGPVELANFWARAKDPVKPIDWVKLIRYNSMLSGPRTMEVNFISNTLEFPWRIARDIAASTIRGRPGEIGVELSGIRAGLDVGNRAFIETLFKGITPEAAARGELPRSVSARTRNPLAKGTATVLESFNRVNQAADEWARALAYSMSMGREAAVTASKEGLRGDAWNARVAQILEHPEAAPELMKRAAGVADRMTWKGDMGAVGTGLERFTNKTGLLGNIVLPFLRTTYHLGARGIERSPAGLVGTAVDVARGQYGPLTRSNLAEQLAGRGKRAEHLTPLGERLGDNLIGSAIFYGLYQQAMDNNISAAGPESAPDRELLRSRGWQPYSVRVGNNWVSYANWGPAAIPFAMAGAAAEAQRYAKPTDQTMDIVMDGMRRTAQVATEMTYLQAIGTAWKGMTQPDIYGPTFVYNTITSLIPFGSAINTLGQALDPQARRPERGQLLDAIQYRLPEGTPIIGGRGDVPPAQDVLGRPLPNVQYGLGALNPLRVSPERQDAVLAELDKYGVSIPPPPKQVTVRGTAIEVKPEEGRELQARAGAEIASVLAEEIAHPDYQRLVPEAKAKRLQQLVERLRERAEKEWINGLPEADYQQRRARGDLNRAPVPVSGR